MLLTFSVCLRNSHGYLHLVESRARSLPTSSIFVDNIWLFNVLYFSFSPSVFFFLFRAFVSTSFDMKQKEKCWIYICYAVANAFGCPRIIFFIRLSGWIFWQMDYCQILLLLLFSCWQPELLFIVKHTYLFKCIIQVIPHAQHKIHALSKRYLCYK